MGFPDKTAYAKVPASDLAHAMRIVDDFRMSLKKEIQEERNILVMSSGFENLDTAMALLSGAEWPKNHGFYKTERLVVEEEATRSRIKDCYTRIEAAKPNTVDGSAAQAACMQMEAALFTVLNMTYETDVQGAVASAMSAARFGLDVAEGLLEAGADAVAGDYLNPGGAMLTDECLSELAKLFRDLCPQAAPPESIGGAG